MSDFYLRKISDSAIWEGVCRFVTGKDIDRNHDRLIGRVKNLKKLHDDEITRLRKERDALRFRLAISERMANKEYRDAFAVADNQNAIALQIVSMRHDKKWTQKELADKCDMHQPQISALEDPDFENVELATLQRVASAFDVALSVRFIPFKEIARAALDGTKPEPPWRDIESAPKDGTPILCAVAGSNFDPMIMGCEDGVFGWLTEDMDFRCHPNRQPTHWMPLPAPPR